MSNSRDGDVIGKISGMETGTHDVRVSAFTFPGHEYPNAVTMDGARGRVSEFRIPAAVPRQIELPDLLDRACRADPAHGRCHQDRS